MTLASLSFVGKTPEEKERLVNVDKISESFSKQQWKILGDMLFGPEALLKFNERIICATSFGVLGVRKNEFGLG